jgi:hypothetical protein
MTIPSLRRRLQPRCPSNADGHLSYTIKNLREIEDVAPKFGFSEVQEARFLSEKLCVPLRCCGGWWMVPGGFGLTHRGFVVSDLARRCRPSPSRTAWRDLIGAWHRPN